MEQIRKGMLLQSAAAMWKNQLHYFCTSFPNFFSKVLLWNPENSMGGKK